MRISAERGLDVLTYTDDLIARDAVELFKQGKADVLLGCMSHYGVGIDLPDGMASVIWILRPGYADPKSAATRFEQQRFKNGGFWKRQCYKVMREAQQGMGRNIRGHHDRGVCFLMAKAFGQFVYHGLPEWLQPAYQRDMMLQDCLKDTKKLLLS